MLVNKELLISAFFCSVLAGCASFAERDYVGYWTGGKIGRGAAIKIEEGGIGKVATSVPSSDMFRICSTAFFIKSTERMSEGWTRRRF